MIFKLVKTPFAYAEVQLERPLQAPAGMTGEPHLPIRRRLAVAVSVQLTWSLLLNDKNFPLIDKGNPFHVLSSENKRPDITEDGCLTPSVVR